MIITLKELGSGSKRKEGKEKYSLDLQHFIKPD